MRNSARDCWFFLNSCVLEFLSSSLLQEFPRIQNSARVQSALDGLVQVDRFPRNRLGPPALLGQADPVLTGDRPSGSDHILEKIVQSSFHLLANFGIVRFRHHDIYVDVPVAGMPETGYWKSVPVP